MTEARPYADMFPFLECKGVYDTPSLNLNTTFPCSKSNEYFRFAEPFLCSYRGLSFLLPLSALDREHNK